MRRLAIQKTLALSGVAQAEKDHGELFPEIVTLFDSSATRRQSLCCHHQSGATGPVGATRTLGVPSGKGRGFARHSGLGYDPQRFWRPAPDRCLLLAPQAETSIHGFHPSPPALLL